MTHAEPTAGAAGGAPSVSVVIPNLDGSRWLEGCLTSLASSTVPATQVIVADDGSTDDSAEVCRRHGAAFLEAPRPRTGFAHTANRGIRQATGDWVFLLNNDTQVDSSALAAFMATVSRDPTIAMVAPLVLSLRDRQTIDSAGMLVFPDATARPRWHGMAVSSATLRPEEILIPSGAAAVFRRSWLDHVGLLDETMTSYLEDVDLGLRVRRAGGRAVFVPDMVVSHWFSGTAGALSPLKARFIERNHTVVAIRHFPLAWTVGLPVWTAIRWLTLIRTVRRTHSDEAGNRRSLRLAGAVLLGTIEGLARIPGAVLERRRLSAAAVVRDAEWRRLLDAHRATTDDYERFGAG